MKKIITIAFIIVVALGLFDLIGRKIVHPVIHLPTVLQMPKKVTTPVQSIPCYDINGNQCKD